MIAVNRLTVAIRNLHSRTLSPQWRFTLVASTLLLLLPFFFRLDGQSHADWLQFLGTFHPLFVHLPIGMLVLLPILEFAGTTRTALRESAAFVLYLTLATGVIALIFGILLAYGSGDTGATVTRHMWSAVVLLIELLVCINVRPAWVACKPQTQRIYPALLTVTLLTLTWTAHQGGSLTHGSDYLTRYMPGPLKQVFPSATTASDAAYIGSVYALNIHPIFEAKCVACHGAHKEKGGLRLDFYDLLIKGGKDGAVFIPRNPDQSLLLQRVTLSLDDRHFMPAEGRTPLTADEIATLRAWIVAGASPRATGVPGIRATPEHADMPFQPVGDYSYLMDDILKMQRSQGAKLVAVSAKPSDGLVLRTIDVASKFDDTQLARFERFAPFIVEAELGRTAVTDGCLDTLSKFTNLRALHLEDTHITGQTLAKLSSLSHLTYLNLSGTKVKSEVLVSLHGVPNLRHVYLFDTPAESATSFSNRTMKNTQ